MSAADFTPERIERWRDEGPFGMSTLSAATRWTAMLDAIEELQAENAQLRGQVEPESGTTEWFDKRFAEAEAVHERSEAFFRLYQR